MKVIISSNAPWEKTAYGRLGLDLGKMFAAAGADVAIVAETGLAGGALTYEGLFVAPPVNTTRAILDLEPDIFLTLLDIWNYSPDAFDPAIPWISYGPIDHDPLAESIARRMKETKENIIYSKFGHRVAQRAGFETTYIPLYADATKFHQVNQGDARQRLGLPQDAYVVSMVADNHGYPSRKALPQQLEAFARFARRHKDALLYCHTNPTVARNGYNLGRLVAQLGDPARIIFPDPARLKSGGFGDAYLRDVYSAADVLLGVSMAEGFGLPLIEAQLCGTPVIAGAWTSMGELVRTGETIREEDSDPFYIPLGGYWRSPRIGAIVAALEERFRAGTPDRLTTAAKVMDYDLDSVVRQYWTPWMNKKGFLAP